VTNRSRYHGMVGLGLFVFLAASWTGTGALQLDGEAVQIDSDDLGGKPTNP